MLKFCIFETQKKEKFLPWDLTKVIYSSRKALDLSLLDSFTLNERDFRNFLSYFIKELIRLRMLIELEPDEIAKVLNEKNDYKYQDAAKKIKSIDSVKINAGL